MTLTRTQLRRHLETTGHLTERGTGRAASRAICRDCGVPTLRGLDADICAFEVHVDPNVLDAIGELLAVLQGRRTYDAVTSSGRLELEPRQPTHMSRRRYPILADHRCHQPLPEAHADTDEPEITDDPPF